MRGWSVCAALLVLPLGGAACTGGANADPAVATPSFRPHKARVPLGSPLELTYRFRVAPELPALDRDYRVFVHFLDAERELMWTDDHEPPKPTTEWTPGEEVAYERLMFVPHYPYIGQASVVMGLYDPAGNTRLSLDGDDNGQRGYRVGSIELLPQSENIFLMHQDGWHGPEGFSESTSVEWSWTTKLATIAFRNPKRNATFYLGFDGRPDILPDQTVTVRVGETEIETLPVDNLDVVIHRLPIRADAFGDGDQAEITLEASETFVPAELPEGNERDQRELGIRVYHTFVDPTG